MDLFRNIPKHTATLDHPINDRIARLESIIEELRQDVRTLSIEFLLLQPSAESAVPDSVDDPTSDNGKEPNKKLTAALTILGAIPFVHDLDEETLHNCVKFADKIYRAKAIREKDLGCPGRLPIPSQILGWMILNYRTRDPLRLDVHPFIDGLFSIAALVPSDMRWDNKASDATSFLWMDYADDALARQEFPF